MSVWCHKNLMLSSWKLFTKQIMTSDADAEFRKHVYKPLKRGSPTPLYYPLQAVRLGARVLSEADHEAAMELGGP